MFGTQPSKTEVAIEVASSVLQIQFTLAGSTLGEVASVRDYYALGYVFGFHDAVCQAFDVSNRSTEAFVVLGGSYAKLASSASTGGAILRQCFDLQENQIFTQGMFAGGREASAYCANQVPPMGLAGHLQSVGTALGADKTLQVTSPKAPRGLDVAPELGR